MKKTIFLPIILGIASILVIFFGLQHANNQEEDMLQNSLSAENTNEIEEPDDTDADAGNDQTTTTTEDTEDTEEKIAEYEANADDLTVLQRIDYATLREDQADLAFFGPIDASSEGYIEASTFIQDNVSGTLQIEEFAHPETDTYELYIQRMVDDVIASEADIVIYSMPALEDKLRDLGVAETNQYLSSILNTLTAGLPDVEIFLMEPVPNLAEINDKNSRWLDYTNYMSEMNTVANTFGLQVIDVHNQFMTLSEEEGFELENLYEEDLISLNEEGNLILEQAIERALNGDTSEE